MRNVMRDDQGDKNPTVLTVASYEESDGLKYPATIRVERDGVILQTKIESAQFSAKPPRDAFVLPEQVSRAMLRAKRKNGMPSGIDLVERYITETGGKDAYGTLKSEKISGEVSLAAASIKGKLSLYEATGGKLYTSMHLPGAGKFETGSDGKLSWERSALLGSRLIPRSQGSRGMLGPGPDQVMSSGKLRDPFGHTWGIVGPVKSK
ncbi:MAG: hypothetical protein ACJ746_20100 [Bryobacteraceae bacterium]